MTVREWVFPALLGFVSAAALATFGVGFWLRDAIWLRCRVRCVVFR
jgi:hypothetical protein